MIINGTNKALVTSDSEGIVDICTFEGRHELVQFISLQGQFLRTRRDSATDEDKFLVSVEFELGSLYSCQLVTMASYEIANLLIYGWKVTLKYEEGQEVGLKLVPINPLI